MFYFTCNEYKIYMKVSLFEISKRKNELFHDILIYWDAPVYDLFWCEHYLTVKHEIDLRRIYLWKHMGSKIHFEMYYAKWQCNM